MKNLKAKILISTGFATALLLAAGCSSTQHEPANAPGGVVAGGYSEAPVKSAEVRAAALYAVQAQTQATAGGGSKLELLAVESASQQVVSGVNYRLQLKVSHKGNVRSAEAVVWWQSWRKPDPYQLTSWIWK